MAALRVTDLIGAAAAVGAGFGCAARGNASGEPATVGIFTMSAGRIGAILAVVVGLIGVVIGGLTLARSGGGGAAGNGRHRAMVALALGPIALIMGGLVVITAKGGVGTGHGLGGGVVAMVVGLIGMAL